MIARQLLSLSRSPEASLFDTQGPGRVVCPCGEFLLSVVPVHPRQAPPALRVIRHLERSKSSETEDTFELKYSISNAIR